MTFAAGFCGRVLWEVLADDFCWSFFGRICGTFCGSLVGEFLGAFCVRVLWNSCGSVLREIKVFMGDFCRRN